MRLSVLISAATIVGNVSSFSSITSSITPQILARRSLRFIGNVHYSGQASARRSSTPSNDEPEYVDVTLKTACKSTTIEIEKGELLRSAMLKRGLSPHNGRSRLINCRGLGTCGTCSVEISCNNDSGLEPKDRNMKERLRLTFPPHGSVDQSPDLRLACQVQVYDDIIVKKRTGFWGQDTDGKLSEGYDAELWFGSYEYLLDSKSPTAKDKK